MAEDDNTAEPDQRPIPLHQNDTVRFKIVLSYWLVVLLGLPLWWASTSIERLRLPKARIMALAGMKEKVGETQSHLQSVLIPS